MEHTPPRAMTALLAAMATVALAGCTASTANPGTGILATSAAPEAASSEVQADACAEYAASSSSGSLTYQVTDDAAFDAALGMDFPGPAECYIGYTVEASGMTVTSIVAIFLDDSSDIADFMNGHLPGAGWPGSVVATGTGYFSDPARGEISYQFNAEARDARLPFDGPAISVMLLGTQ